MKKIWRASLSIAFGLLIFGSQAAVGDTRISDLRCEYRVNPSGIDVLHPRLTWGLQSKRRGERQTAYQILVASRPELLWESKADLWDSGKVESDQSVHVEYAGKPLESRMRCHWQVRVWDKGHQPSAWSPPALWTMGLLDRSDWQGKWIGATTVRSGVGDRVGNGFHAAESSRPEEHKWVQVDLGRTHTIDSVCLVPAHPRGYGPGFGFPLRFRIEASNEETFAKPTVIVDRTASDYPNPGDQAQSFDARGISARFIRVTATHLWQRPDGVYCFALREFEAISQGKNVANGAGVSARDSVERYGWGKKQLTDGQPASVAHQNVKDPGQAAVLMRKPFDLNGKVTRATASICGLGYYELFINGQKIGDHKLDPGFTDYRKRLLYVTYDVTQALRQGPNVVAVMLGGGWYDMRTPDTWGFHKSPWSAPPKLLLQLNLELADGTTHSITSDESWKWSTGHIIYQCLRGGETHDLRLAKPDWNTVGYSDGDWNLVEVVPAPEGRLVAQKYPPIKATREIRPIKITEPKPSVYVYHLPENLAGWMRLTVTGKPGQRVKLIASERLHRDGTVNLQNASFTHGRYQTDEIILNGGGPELFEPRFCYHGFQYVQVEGLNRKPKLEDLVAVKVHSAVAPAGEFACSNESINAIHAMATRTYLNNLHGMPTDCPTREKLGWLCDGTVTSEMAIYNFDMAALFTKWMQDMRDAQTPSGYMPGIVPTNGWSSEGQRGANYTDPWWGGAVVLHPWNVYRYYGDSRVLEQQYSAMKAYVDYLSTRAQGHIVKGFALGDWLEVGAKSRPKRTPVELTSTAAYAWYARIVGQTAELLGNHEDAMAYKRLSEQIRDALNERFFDTETGLYGADSQTASALALDFDLVPQGKRPLVLRGLLDNIAKRHGHLSTGIVGTLYLFNALSTCGRDNVAHEIVTAEGFPGWRHMMASGATTIWEDWNGRGSHDHPTLGSVGAWFFKSLAGIRPAKAGFKEILIRPAIVGDLAWVKAHYNSVYGRISSAWRRDGKTVMLHIEIPVNTTATVYVPTSDASTITEGGRPAEQAEGVSFLRVEDGAAVYRVGSGQYHFVSRDVDVPE